MVKISLALLLASFSVYSLNANAGLVEVIEPNHHEPERPTVFVDYGGELSARVKLERDQDRRSLLVQNKAVTYVSLRPPFKFRLDLRSETFSLDMDRFKDLRISLYIEPTLYKKTFDTLEKLQEHITNIIRETGNVCYIVEAREIPTKDVVYLNDAKLESAHLIQLNFFAGEDGKTLLKKFNSKIMRLFFQAPPEVTQRIDNLFGVGQSWPNHH